MFEGLINLFSREGLVFEDVGNPVQEKRINTQQQARERLEFVKLNASDNVRLILDFFALAND